jgi:transcriptional regulator with XRE-family HTH domain
MNITSYSAVVADARKRAKLTQRELAHRAHAAQPLVARIESGRANPTVETLDRLLGAAGFELRVQLVPKAAPDPVVEAYKRDVDRTLLIENLRKTPAQRVQTLVAMEKLVREARRAMRAKQKRK